MHDVSIPQQVDQVAVTERIPIGAVRLPDCWPRTSGGNDEYAQILAETEASLPPIVVHRSTMRIIDGVHRWRAALLRGEECIEVRFFEGSADDAFVLAVELNREHGLPLTLADRTAAATRIINSHPHWSDRWIARVAGLAANTVGSLRRRSTEHSAQSNIRIGLDGRARPYDIAAGRQLAGELITRSPEASLREIAKATGISLATVSDVRARLRRGEPPTTSRQRAVARRRRGTTVADGQVRLGPVDRAYVIENLKKDPSIRFTASGRALLRLLDSCALASDQWEQILDSVPAHCKAAVVNLARECAGSWQEFADRLAQREDVYEQES